MGQGQSDGSSAAQSPFDSIPSNDRHGWKVMQVMANSPSSGLGIVPYFSVLTHINGVRCGRDESDLFPLIKENQAAQLTFLNLATLTNRTVTVTPRRGWGGDGLLGLMIRHDWFENAHLETIHVLDVHHGSPAEAAGLRAHVDYLLGTSRLAFKGYDSLDLFLTQYNGVDGRVVVFNKDSFSVREVMIKPSNSWGGAGSLGCDVACGFLHQLPLDGKRDVYFEAEGPGAASAGVAGIPQPVQTQPTQQQQFVPQQPQQAFPPQQQQQQHFQGQQFQQQQVVFDPTQPHAPLQQFANPQAVYEPTQQQFAQQQFAHPQQQQQQQQQQFHQQQVAFDPTQLQQQHLSPQHVQQQAQQQAQHQVAFDPTQLAAAPAHQQHQQHQQQQQAAFPQDPAAPTPAAAPVEAQQQHAVSHEQHFHQQQQQSPPQQVPQQQHQQQFQQQQQHAQPASFEPAAAAPAAQPAAAAAPAAGAPQFSPEQMQQFLAWQAAQQQQQFGQVTVPQRGGLP